jgi:SOS-response transcriptional repressor LexA
MSEQHQNEILRYIVEFKKSNGFPPTITEMTEHFNCARSTIQWHLDKMAREGKMTRVPGASRAIAITPDGLKQMKAIGVERL